MQITITIPDEFVADVQARGLDVQLYVQQLMDEIIARDFPPSQTPEERENAIDRLIRSKRSSAVEGKD